jgi:hypothetical protein
MNSGSLPTELFFILSLMLRPTVSRPVCLGIKHPYGLTTRSLLLYDICRLVEVGRSLWRQDGSVVYNCCWPSPAQSFRVRVPWDTWPYITVSESSRSFSSPPTTRKATVKVFDPASTPLHGPSRKHSVQEYLCYCIRIRCRRNVLTSRCLETALVYLFISRSLHSNDSTR